MRTVAVTISAAGYDMTAQIIAEWAANGFEVLDPWTYRRPMSLISSTIAVPDY